MLMVPGATLQMNTMTTKGEFSPWSKIETPKQNYAVRKIPGTSELSLYWGKNSTGNCLFIIEFSGDYSETYGKGQINIQGLMIDLRAADRPNLQRLVITLERSIDEDIFHAMCQTLISALKDVSNSALGMSVSLSQIKRWKDFMANKHRQILSQEEIAGLFGELTFLKELLEHHSDDRVSISAWEGPEGSHQDFILGNKSVEIKTLTGRDRSSIRISSEDQLESLNQKLYLKLLNLIKMPESDESSSLNELVHQIEKRISSTTQIEEFWSKLAKAGYVELDEYNNPKFIVADDHTYIIQDNFPKLIRSELPDGIHKIYYSIELKAIKSFKVENRLIWDE